MIGPEDAQWVRSTANELNNLVQVIGDSGECLARMAAGNPEAAKYIEMMRSSVDRAASVTRQMMERVSGGGNLPVTSPGWVAPPVSEKPQQPKTGVGVSTEEVDGIKIFNPNGVRELILVVDDEDYVCLLAQRMLAEEGYKIITARDGFQALKIYGKLQDQIALVILDFTMPIMDGSEVFQELRSVNPRIPVVLSSGYAEQEKVQGMLAKGLRGFLPKPYTQQKMLSQVRSVLDSLKRERMK